MNPDILLYTSRTYLRQLKKEDASNVYLGWMIDQDVNRFLESRFYNHTTDSLAEYIENANKSISPKKILLGIFEKKNEIHIGNVKAEINSYHNTAEIGFFIGEKSYWGQGYASEMLNRFCDYLLNVLYIEKITAGCYESNLGSRKTLEKIGFMLEAELRSEVALGDDRISVLRFALFNKSTKRAKSSISSK